MSQSKFSAKKNKQVTHMNSSIMIKKKIENKNQGKKNINVTTTWNMGRHLGLKDMHEGCPREVLEVVNWDYINLWSS